MFDCTITVSEAAAYSGIPIRKWFAWIEKGLVVSSPGPPDHLNCSEQAAFAPLCRIPISALPRPAAMRFIQERILHESFFSVDFIGYLNRQGEAAFAELLETIRLLKRASFLREIHPLSSTAVLRHFAIRNGMSLSTMYRKESCFMASDLKKLIRPAFPSKTVQSRKLCLLSRDYLTCHHLKPNALSQNQLLRNLSAEAERLGSKACTRCPYNPVSRSRQQWTKNHPDTFLPDCSVSGSGMIFPDTRYPVNRWDRLTAASLSIIAG